MIPDKSGALALFALALLWGIVVIWLFNSAGCSTATPC